MQPVRTIIILIAAVAGCFAAVMAFLISYEEYARHFPDKKKPRMMALEFALVAFTFFLAIGVALALLLPSAP